MVSDQQELGPRFEGPNYENSQNLDDLLAVNAYHASTSNRSSRLSAELQLGSKQG